MRQILINIHRDRDAKPFFNWFKDLLKSQNPLGTSYKFNDEKLIVNIGSIQRFTGFDTLPSPNHTDYTLPTHINSVWDISPEIYERLNAVFPMSVGENLEDYIDRYNSYMAENISTSANTFTYSVATPIMIPPSGAALTEANMNTGLNSIAGNQVQIGGSGDIRLMSGEEIGTRYVQ